MRADLVRSQQVTRKRQSRECENCNRRFLPMGSRQNWCPRCRTVECRTCRMKFRASPSKIQSGTVVYCSRPCLYAGREFRTGRMCTGCGSEFISRSGRRTVCDACCTVSCEVCGAKRRVKPSKVASARFCGGVCKAKAESSFVFSKQDIVLIKQNYPLKMSAKQLAEELGAPVLAVRRTISKLDLPACPITLRNERSGESRLLWTKERVASRVVKLYEQGEANSALAQQRHRPVYMAALHRFGSWRAAVELHRWRE